MCNLKKHDPKINKKRGGYLNGLGHPSDVLRYGLDKTDEALGDMISALKSEGIYDSTLFIVTAKHGQSPINFEKLNKPGHFADVVATLPDAAATWPRGRSRNLERPLFWGKCIFFDRRKDGTTSGSASSSC